MTIFSSIGDWITRWTKTFEQGTPPATTKLMSEFLVFFEGVPYAQIAAAALAEGINVPLDITAGAALIQIVMKAFFSGQSVQAATNAVAAHIGISTAVASLIIYDPIHPVDPTQFSRGH